MLILDHLEHELYIFEKFGVKEPSEELFCDCKSVADKEKTLRDYVKSSINKILENTTKFSTIKNIFNEMIKYNYYLTEASIKHLAPIISKEADRCYSEKIYYDALYYYQFLIDGKIYDDKEHRYVKIVSEYKIDLLNSYNTQKNLERLAYCELKEKKYSEALYTYNRIKEKDADILNKMGLCYENKKSYKEAAQY